MNIRFNGFSNLKIRAMMAYGGIVKREDLFGVTGYFKDDLAPGLRSFEIQM